MAISIVQSTALVLVQNTGTASFSLTGVTAGNTLVITLAVGGDSTTETVPTFPTGWVVENQVTPGGANYSIVAYLANAPAGTNTVNLSSTNAPWWTGEMHEVSGAGALDLVLKGTGPGTSLATSTGTPAVTGEICFTVCAVDGATTNGTFNSTPPSGFTSLWTETNDSSYATGGSAYEVLSSTSSITPTWTVTSNPLSSGGWSVIAVTFKPAGSTALNLGAAQGIACSIGAVALGLSLALAASGIGSSTGGTQLSQIQSLSAQAHSSSIGSASLSIGIPLSASAIASSVGSASLALMQPLSASGVASSVGQTFLAQSLALSGLGNASSLGTGALTVTSATALALGQALANAGAIGSAQLSIAQPMQATAQGSSIGIASLSQQLSLAATAQASSIGAASLQIAQPLAGTANGSSAGSANLTIGFPLFGTAKASSSGTASLTIKPFAGYAFDPEFYAILPARNFYGAGPPRSFYAAATYRNFYAQPKRNMPAIILQYAKDPREVKTITLDATADLPTGATLTGITNTQITVTRGSDPSPSAAFGTPIINSAQITVPGAAAPIAANMAVQIPATAGIDGCWYEIAVTCTTSASPNTETLKAVLMVSAA